MSRQQVSRIHRLISKALDEAGLEHYVVSGKKHQKLYVGGRMLMVFSHGPGTSHDLDRIHSFIRRAKEAKDAALT